MINEFLTILSSMKHCTSYNHFERQCHKISQKLIIQIYGCFTNHHNKLHLLKCSKDDKTLANSSRVVWPSPYACQISHPHEA